MIFEFECTECGKHFDYEFKMEDYEKIHPICPCGSYTVKKVWSVAGIDFKGSGFYVNDYKRKENDILKKEV